MRPTHLRCEYKIDPLGIGETRPRLFWLFETDRSGAKQTAYQIECGASPEFLGGWDSGKVESDETTHIPYGGPALVSRERVYWRVKAWDEHGKEGEWSDPAFFEAGLLDASDWTAEWIGARISGGARTAAPVPFFRTEFDINFTPVRARLYVTARGVYEARLNGQRIGDDYFAPGWTDYRKRIQYQVYDVEVQRGRNALGAILGDGWFCGNVEWRGRQLYGEKPWFLAQLEVTYEDGSTEIVATDGSWRHNFGPILESDMLMGESYDARKELEGWDLPEFDDRTWMPVEAETVEASLLVAMPGPPVKATEEISPVSDPKRIDRWPAPDYLFDLGQNMVGFVRLKVKGDAGTTVRLRFGEVLDDKGNLYTDNLRSAKQTDYYTLKGDPDGEVWEPRFTFHGFRYVEVRGIHNLDRESITGVVLHSDTPKTGSFECSDELVNQLQKNIDWGQRGNFVDIPTDCPQRDERLGWTGDAQVFIRTAAFNRDVAGFFTKWQEDVRDAQGPDGQVPPTCPTTGVVGDDGGPAWADAVIICPWTIYLCYGDTQILQRHYESMKAFVGFMESTSKDLIRCHPTYEKFRGFGDWLSINADTSQDLIGTAFFAYGANLLSQIAAVLGKDDDQARYRRLFEDVRSAFQKRYVTPNGLMTPPTQTAYILALQFDLLPEDVRPAAQQELVDDIGRRGWHLSAGFVGSPYINHVLTGAGRNDVAYKLLFQKTWPSWLYAVTKGATTIWERWDGWTEEKGFQDITMNSFNHYAYGAIGSWLYEKVAGIDLDPARPGYRHIIFRPQPAEGLTWARASFDSIHGRIESAWRREGDQFDWRIRVPANCTGTVYLPNSTEAMSVESGVHEFS
jgi:alpha-L-rhamnosidase